MQSLQNTIQGIAYINADPKQEFSKAQKDEARRIGDKCLQTIEIELAESKINQLVYNEFKKKNTAKIIADKEEKLSE